MPAQETPAQVRAELVTALGLDLIGPAPDHEYAEEVLSIAPSRWYLTGFLVPHQAPDEQRSDPNAQEEISAAGDEPGTDDDQRPESTAAKKVFFPSSMGLSVLVGPEVGRLQVNVHWGDYSPISAEEASGAHRPAGAESDEISQPRSLKWQRNPRAATLVVELKEGSASSEVSGSAGLRVVVSVREVPASKKVLVPKGTRAVSVFLVNERAHADDEHKDKAFAFQASLALSCPEGFTRRPDLHGLESTDPDDRIADLQYRDVAEFGVGHGVACRALVDADGLCRRIESTWMPTAEVEKVVPGELQPGMLNMETLAGLPTPQALEAHLLPLVNDYERWIAEQGKSRVETERRAEVQHELLERAAIAKRRIKEGLELLGRDPQAFLAFSLANRAMAMQARRRRKDFDGKGRAPEWRPFQLAFLLLNLRGVAEPTHPEREIVDLLFFPTGGGKTEAYLGLAAFTLVLRRLRDPGPGSCGVSVLMRYTLRLLTLDQLSRASTLICALELIRREDPKKLGAWPFEIGLWVGSAATPNRLGKKGDNSRYTARARVSAYQGDPSKGMPIPIEKCPWCDAEFKKESFKLTPNEAAPLDLQVSCLNRNCDFSPRRLGHLPLLAIDEPIYRRLPCFLIATVDKFAGLPWLAQAGALFGKVDRHNKDGFYGPGNPGTGARLEGGLPPPDLIIQDELHLISGPLGTMAGLYETAIDSLASRKIEEQVIRPKVVASTATVRRAQRQIQALFARRRVEVFPPPGPDLRDSFFAKVVPPNERHARLYVGLAAQGRSAKVLLLRTYLALMGAAQKAYLAAGGDKNPDNPADPYLTLLGYFNSLRELGGSRRIVEDEVRARVVGYSKRQRFGESHGLFADRRIKYDVLELTSRESTSKVSAAKRRLEVSFPSEGCVDVALATNMISVGLDIVRLGLMVVLGQPKTTAEYIQATSRVGRDENRPGLVVTLLNVHKPRDRSHYERFGAFHASFYRAVEATSVTPFAPRAIDRGLAGVVVAIARHGDPAMTAPRHAGQAHQRRGALEYVAEVLAARAFEHDAELPPVELEAQRARLRRRVDDLLDAWAKLAKDYEGTGGLQYQREETGAPPLLRDPLDPEPIDSVQRLFRAHRSLRDVEPSVNLWVSNLEGSSLDTEDLEP